nr:helix-turn-helix transcriptional regulator [uncultured Lachnoclostridium sp.]
MAKIGRNIREQRMKKGLSQEELAERLYVTRQTISNYETGGSLR